MFISIHALREEGDGPAGRTQPQADDFYPRPPRGGRLAVPWPFWRAARFLSTPSARRATLFRRFAEEDIDLFLSTPSARRATPDLGGGIQDLTISIHALREEGDSHRQPLMAPSSYFYPRPPRGGRQRGAHYAKRRIEFLSPPSARRATRLPLRHKGEQIYFYPRPPRGGRLRPPAPCCPGRYFYPRPPRGGRHPGGLGDHQKVGISIPALREEGDPAVPATRSASSYFYPRPPRGGRLSWPSKEAVPRRHISIPALREEGDTVYMRGCKVDSEFLSPPSARRATARRLRRKEAITYFYPRPPRGGRLHCW